MNEGPKRPEAEKAVGRVVERPDIYSIDTSVGQKESPKWSLGGLGEPRGSQKGPRRDHGDPWEAVGVPWGVHAVSLGALGTARGCL